MNDFDPFHMKAISMEYKENDVVEESATLNFHWTNEELVKPAIRACRERLRAQGGFSQLKERKNLLGDFELRLQLKGSGKAVLECLLLVRSIERSSWDAFRRYAQDKGLWGSDCGKDMVENLREYLDWGEGKGKTH